MEILFVLKEIKPCILFWAPAYGSETTYTRLFETCLAPLIEKYQLGNYGFVAHKIIHAVPTETHCGFQKAYVLADTRSDHWDHVQDVFLVPHPGQKRDESRIGKALGYPIPQNDQNYCVMSEYIIDELRGDGTEDLSHADHVKYKDMTEKWKLRWITGSNKIGDKVGAVDAFAYRMPANLRDSWAIRAHFEACLAAARSVGHELGLSLPVNDTVQGQTRKDNMVVKRKAKVSGEKQ